MGADRQELVWGEWTEAEELKMTEISNMGDWRIAVPLRVAIAR